MNADKSMLRDLIESWAEQIRVYVSEAAGLEGAPSTAEWDTGLQELREIIEDARVHRGYGYE